MTEAMEVEFDTLALWTEEILAELGPEYAVPAACRGSASPGALAWLAESLELRPGVRFLDTGAGLAGPAAWLREHYDADIVVTEPMVGAARGGRRLFGFASTAAWSERLPFADGAFEAAWALGVLSTTAAHGAVLSELRRVLRPGGRLGLLVFGASGDQVTDPPDGNHFPPVAGLDRLCAEAGFGMAQMVDAPSLSGAPLAWTTRMNRVEEEAAARHGLDPRWAQAKAQEERMDRLLSSGEVVIKLVLATAL